MLPVIELHAMEDLCRTTTPREGFRVEEMTELNSEGQVVVINPGQKWRKNHLGEGPTRCSHLETTKRMMCVGGNGVLKWGREKFQVEINESGEVNKSHIMKGLVSYTDHLWIDYEAN